MLGARPVPPQGPSTCSSLTNNEGTAKAITHGQVSSRLLGRLESRNLAASRSYPEVQLPTARLGLILAGPQQNRPPDASLTEGAEAQTPGIEMTGSLEELQNLRSWPRREVNAEADHVENLNSAVACHH